MLSEPLYPLQGSKTTAPVCLHVHGMARCQCQACHRSRGGHEPIEYRNGMACSLRLPSHDAPAGGNLLVYGEYPPGKAPG